MNSCLSILLSLTPLLTTTGGCQKDRGCQCLVPALSNLPQSIPPTHPPCPSLTTTDRRGDCQEDRGSQRPLPALLRARVSPLLCSQRPEWGRPHVPVLPGRLHRPVPHLHQEQPQERQPAGVREGRGRQGRGQRLWIQLYSLQGLGAMLQGLGAMLQGLVAALPGPARALVVTLAPKCPSHASPKPLSFNALHQAVRALMPCPPTPPRSAPCLSSSAGPCQAVEQLPLDQLLHFPSNVCLMPCTSPCSPLSPAPYPL